MIGKIGRMFGFGVPAMGPQAGFGAGYNINAGQMPFTGQGRGLGEMSQEDLDEEMRRIRELQAMQQSQIQAPKDRGMFGRFAGFNPFRFDPDKGVGEGNRLYAIGAGLAGMGTGDPGLTAELLEPRLKANRERVAARDRAEQERQRMEAFMQTADLTPSERAAFNLSPDAALKQYLERTGRPPEQAEYGLDLVPVRDPETGRTMYVQASKAGGYRPVEGIEPLPEASDENWTKITLEDGEYEYILGRPDTLRKIGPSADRIPPPGIDLQFGEGGVLSGLSYGTGGTGKEAAIVQTREGTPAVTPSPQQQSYNKAVRAVDEFAAQKAIVLGDIDKALETVGNMSTGAMAWTADIPIIGGITPAGQLESLLETIRANVGFDKLQAMREASPTGGALGSVTERELAFLQAVFGSLRQDLRPENVRRNLERLRAHMEGREQRIRAALAQDYPSLAQTAQFRADTAQQMQDLASVTDDDLMSILTGGQ